MAIKDAIRECQEYIQNNLDKDLTVEHLAERLNFSPHYLRKCFKTIEGVSIGKYVQNARLARAAHDLIQGLCIVTKAAQISGFSSVYSFSRTFHKVFGVPPSEYIGAENLPIIKIFAPITVAGYVLRRADNGAEPGIALWHGYDFSLVNPTDFAVVSPEGGAEIGVWTEIEGERSYLFGVICADDAEIPRGMVRCEMEPGSWAMFPVPTGTSSQELFENMHSALKSSLEHCSEAEKFEPIIGKPCMEYYSGNEFYLCVPVRERQNKK